MKSNMDTKDDMDINFFTLQIKIAT